MHPPRFAPVVLLVALGALLAGPAGAKPVEKFRTMSLAFTGGFQSWSLSGLEETLDGRTMNLEAEGYDFGASRFGITYAYGAEFAFRLTETLFLRTHMEWTRLRWEDRDRQFLATLGGQSRTPISVSMESRVQSRPLLFALGAGTARELSAIRLALSGSLLVVPVRLEDRVQVAVIEAETETQVSATGTGLGFELGATVDYFTEVRTTLYLEGFWRAGSTTVTLEDSVWDGSTFPGERRIDFDGFGLRLGLRWI